jgi:hypothetical protein
MDRNTEAQSDGDATYRKLVLLDDLESLLEEVEEHGIEEDDTTAAFPNDLYQRMEDLEVSSITEIRGRIAELHRELDQED